MTVSIKFILGRSFVFEGLRLSIGGYLHDDNCVTLIDSGLDDSTASRLDQILKRSGFTPSSILNTHSHADHCGGNAYFQKKYPALKIYATKFEASFIETPYLEPFALSSYGQPFPFIEENKFLRAQPSVVTHSIPDNGQVTIEGNSFNLVNLKGHSQGMVTVITPDKIAYLGDALFSGDTLEKHAILFATHIDDLMQSYEKLKTLKDECKGFVLYHGGYHQSIDDLIDLNIQKTQAGLDNVFEILKDSDKSFTVDELTSTVMRELKITPAEYSQFLLTRACIQGYVSYYSRHAMINTLFEDYTFKITPNIEYQEKKSPKNSERSFFGGRYIKLIEEAAAGVFKFTLQDESFELMKAPGSSELSLTDIHANMKALWIVDNVIKDLSSNGLMVDKGCISFEKDGFIILLRDKREIDLARDLLIKPTSSRTLCFSTTPESALNLQKSQQVSRDHRAAASF